MNYNRNEQALAFDRVLPWENQIEAVSFDETGTVFLQIKAPEAKKVSFVMLETEYDCTRDKEGVWRVKYPFSTGINFVQLKIDGAEVLTPMLPIGYGYSRPYNYVVLDVVGEDFYQIQDVPHGSIRREYFFSKVTKEWESCMVYTPAVYEKQPDKKFPVLYLQHGHGENEVGWSAAGKVNFMMDNLIAEKKAAPFLIVMSNGMVQTIDEEGNRIVDFRLFEKQLLEDIIPFIEGNYHVGKEKSMRAMAGLSMGSLQTSITGFMHPEYFSCLGVFSGFMTNMIEGSRLDQVKRGPGDNAHLKILDDREQFAKEFPVFFRAMGTEDPFWEDFKRDDGLCEEKQITQIRKTYPGAHDWNVWRRCFFDFAQLIFK